MHFCVSKFKQHWLFCYFITLLIVLLIWTTLLYTSISFSVSSTVHECFQSSFLPIVITLQVLHIIFKGQVHPKNIITHLWRVHNVLSIGTMHSPKWKSSVKLWSEVLSWLPLSVVKQGKFQLAIVMSQTILVCVCVSRVYANTILLHRKQSILYIQCLF